jgi:uncharacterized protein YqjF (DUF2071 family)
VPAPLGLRWERLAFIHWTVDPSTLAGRLPPGIALDVFGGEAWLALVPLRIARTSVLGLPLPRALGAYGQVNLRTYVQPEDPSAGPPGIWLLSSDVGEPTAVVGARTLARLPYWRARVEMQEGGPETEVAARRRHRGAAPAAFEARYGALDPEAAPFTPAPGSLESWFVDRFSVYGASRGGALWRIDVAHDPWRLRPAALDLRKETLIAAAGLPSGQDAPLVHVAEPLDVRVRVPRRVG